MNVELGKLPNGNMVILSDTSFPSEVKRVEYYRDQSLVMLVYDEESGDGDLMEYELSEEARESMEESSNAVIVTAMPGADMSGYDVPIVQVGELYA